MKEGTVFAALHQGFDCPVRDSLWGHIYLPPSLEAITRTQPFMRLFRVLQLGPAYLRYPGATHTRAAHSLGVYHIALRLLRNISDGAPWLTAAGCRSFLCAALLHDAGHFPYAHSLKELPLLTHESLSAEVIRGEPVRSLVGLSGADPDMAAGIVDQDAPSSDKEVLFYRKLLSGTLDPDKLDYLNRDARFCGVPYGAQDVDFILSTLRPHEERGLVIDERGVTGVESLLFSKYLMYRSVYWHHAVRAATGAVKKSLAAGLREGVITAEELYGLDDSGLFALLLSKHSPLFSLALQARTGDLFSLVSEFPFDESLSSLADIRVRPDYETALASLLQKRAPGLAGEEVIIDLPEPVSFESELFVSPEDGGSRRGLCCEKPFSDCSSLFKGEAAATFTRALRVVRVFVDKKYAPRMDSNEVQQNLREITKTS